MAIGIYVLQALLGAAFALSGAAKIAGARVHVSNFKKWGLSQRSRLFVGGVEFAGALGVVLGIWLHGLAPWAALLLFATMIGAILVHRGVKDPFSQWMPAVVFLAVSGFVCVGYFAGLA